MSLYKVAVDAPLLNPLSYLAPAELNLVRGDIVNVPLGKRVVKGFVLGVDHNPAEGIQYKEILTIDPEWPRLKDPFLKWMEWMADYYIYPIGRVIQLAFPPLRKNLKPRASKRPPVVPQLEIKDRPELTEEQSICVQNILSDISFKVHLIRGVTGSGKTEVYLRLFEDCLKQDKKGLFLLPEISLTPQLVHRFVERFGDQVAVIHSQLTDRERSDQWWQIIEGDKKILIGARSALFCPLQNLGLIVVDEEHETSFKQDEKLKYHGRDCAIMLGKFHQCPVILGSATPSLESWKNALDQKYQLHTLNQRVGNRLLPEVKIIDMKKEKENSRRKSFLPFWLSVDLYESLVQRIERKEQSALLLNRRGFAQTVFCQSCGYSADCPNCDISLTLHSKAHLICHYCDYHQDYQLKCPDCSEGELKPLGLGTEKVEEDLKILFPDKIIARADRDEITHRVDMEQLIEDMELQKIDILIGTQMIAKGLDFKYLTLVGHLLADVGFNLPDFRSSEKSFQLMTQMSGRAGRHVTHESLHQAEVFIQAYNTDHESLKFTQTHDYLGFAENELLNRAPLHYPPFHKLLAFRIQSLSQEKAEMTSQQILWRAEKLKEHFPQSFAQIEILGPSKSPLAKLKNVYRFHLLLKGQKSSELASLARKILGDEKWIPTQVKVLVDVDPISLL